MNQSIPFLINRVAGSAPAGTIIPKKVVAGQKRFIKKLIWLYFFLLIFEGALRKWVLPGLATPLLIIRDPLALWILVAAGYYRLFRFNMYAYSMILIGILAIFTALFLGHGNLFVALFGARIMLLHFPLIFVIGVILDRQDVVNAGKVLLYITPLMTILIALQFYSPQSAWVNRGVGGDLEGAGFSGALGFFRPPGTFSFTNGTSLFFGLVAPFILYFWAHPKEIPKWVLLGATLGLLAAIPISISRTLFFSVIVSLLFMVVVALQRPKYFVAFTIAGLGLIILFLSLGKMGGAQTAVDAFTTRFNGANKTEGGIQGVLADRYLGGMINALTANSAKLPFFGYGLGMGTNVGSMLLTGKTSFLISEGEWGRLIGEMGILFGFLIILIRLSLSFRMLVASYRRLLAGDLLPWILLSFGILQIPQGQWAQPTSLGFATIIGGFIIASFNNRQETEISS